MKPHYRDKVSPLARTSLHYLIFTCMCIIHVAWSSLTWLWEADWWTRVWDPTVWRLGGYLWKALEGQLSKKTCWNQWFMSLLISLLHLQSFVCPWGYRNLDLNHKLNNLKMFQTEPVPARPPDNLWLSEQDPAKEVDDDYISWCFT